MCGIVGFSSKTTSAVRPLVSGLSRLEYRGYDSAGIALESADGIRVFKQTGKVSELDKLLKRELPEEERAKYTLGIAHTRWATHGLPTVANAHPHIADDGRLALVHNGIIENYASLRSGLERRGVKFASQTDTEVLAHLVAAFDKGDFLAAVCEALKRVEGTYGIATVSARHPGEMVVARKGSPLVIGIGEKDIVVASDVSAIVAYTRQVIYLKDGDVARITAEGVDIHSLDNAPVSREVQEVDWDVGAIEKGGYEHFMLKEIFEQPDALANTIRGRLDPGGGTAILPLAARACGGAQARHRRMRHVAPRGNGREVPLRESCGHSGVARAGGGVQVFESDRRSGRLGDRAVAVRRDGRHSRGRARVDKEGRPEISVASTKAFTAQVTALLMTALKLGRTRRLSREAGDRLVREITSLPDLVRKVLAQSGTIAQIAEKYASANDMFFIGRGILYPVALEGALKIKEVAYVHAEGYQAAELKHGPIALLSEKTPVVALLADVPGKEKTLGNVQECRARNAPVIAVATEGDDAAAASATDAMFVPKTSPELAPIVSAVALQLFAYHVARLRGCEIDQPRNLAKSVTVE